MSIQWREFATDIEFTPTNIAKEVKRITNVPPNVTFNDFMHVLHVERNTTTDDFKKKILEFCIAVYYYQLMKRGSEDEIVNQLKPVVNRTWTELCDWVETCEYLE